MFPVDGGFTQTGEETPELAGGNPGLAAEKAEISTAGFTWLPVVPEGLELSVDFYDITIDNGVASLGAETILAQRLATGADAFCRRIERAPDGSIERIQAQLQNLATESARGVDIDLRYSLDAFGGELAQRLLLSYVDERALVAFPGAEPLVGAGGYDRDTFGAIPVWRGSYRLNWSGGRWRGGYEAQWIGAIDETGGAVVPGTVNAVDAEIYHDVHLSYDVAPRVTLAIGIDNVTDEQPPFFGNADEANTDVSTYRLLGTTGWLRLSMEL
ncbi:MAG: TonB-dependent receptor [Gammaproteobacteria bacterium]|nr:TonB-dependent receptor [Gammaproteobacteria bacterium]